MPRNTGSRKYGALQKGSPLEQQLTAILDHRESESRLRQLTASPPGSVDLSSNDFLSLSTSVSFRNAYLKELHSHTFQLGSTGSRLLDGNSEYAEALERDIASFHGGEAGLLTNSGFDANVSIFSCIPQPGDVIVYDELIHASVHDGMRASRATKRIPFAHNSVSDLRCKLSALLDESKSERGPPANVFIAVESVYSMEGDVAPLLAIVETAEALFQHNNAHIIVDEAHATGVYGPQGEGLVSALGLEKRVFARLHTFGKALACNGAIIICSPVTRLYLINYARPLIYTTFMSFPSLAAIRVAYETMRTRQTIGLASVLFRLISLLHEQLQRVCQHASNLGLPEDMLNISAECPESPIFALLTRQPRDLAKFCQNAGFVVRAVVPPTVPIGTERVRVCLHAGNTEAEIEAFVGVVRRWVENKAAEARLQIESVHEMEETQLRAKM